MRFLISGRQSQGGRDYQEDSWSVVTSEGYQYLNVTQDDPIESDENALVVVSDGIGSGGHGDVASQHIAKNFAVHLKDAGPVSPDSIQQAIKATDAELGRIKTEKSYGRSMGGTIVAGLFHDRTLTFLSIGDSLLLRFRDDEIHYMNEKHAFGHEQDELAGIGQKSWRDALRQQSRASITSAVIGRGIGSFQIAARDIRPGDTYVLASDGVETIDGELLRRLVFAFREASETEALTAILDAVDAHGQKFEKGEHDNTTVVMVRCEGDPSEQNSVIAGGRVAARTEPQPVAPTQARDRRRPVLMLAGLLLVSALAAGAYLATSFLQGSGDPGSDTQPINLEATLSPHP